MPKQEREQRQKQERARGGTWMRLCAGLCLGAALLGAACAAEDEARAPEGEACGSEGLTCRGGKTCVSYAAIFECVRPCETTSTCGAGSCCTHRDKYFAPYCVALGDPLGRAGSECLPLSRPAKTHALSPHAPPRLSPEHPLDAGSVPDKGLAPVSSFGDGGTYAPTLPILVAPTPRALRRLAWREAADLLTHPVLEEEIVCDLAFELTGDLHARLPPEVVRDYAAARAGVVRTIERLYLRTTPNNPRKAKKDKTPR